MPEIQPTAYVVCRARRIGAQNNKKNPTLGVRLPVKVFDTRDEARGYVKRMNARSKLCRYTVHRVKQG